MKTSLLHNFNICNYDYFFTREILINTSSNINYFEEIFKQFIATIFALLLAISIFYITERRKKQKSEKDKKIFILKYLKFFIKNFSRNIYYDYNFTTHVRLEKLNDYFIYINKINGLEEKVDILITFYESWKDNKYFIHSKETDLDKDKTLNEIEITKLKLEEIKVSISSILKDLEDN